MPKKAKELSAVEVRRLEHHGGGGSATYAVGGVDGLMLQITPSGTRSWVLRAVVGGVRRKIGLGTYPTTGLSQARERARLARDEIAQGRDPVLERQAARAALAAAQARAMTFREAVERYAEIKEAEFRSEKSRKQWRSSLERLAMPVLGDLPVADITRQDLQRMLEPIWMQTNFTAVKVRGRVEAVLAWATVAGHRTGDNPAAWKGNLELLLPAPAKVTKKKHYPALAVADAPRWMAALRANESDGARALQFVALSLARSGEVRDAVWSEIDLDAGLWVIPAERMKMERPHRVPLSAEAVTLLRALPRRTHYVFPGERQPQLSANTINKSMKALHKADEKAGGAGFTDPTSGRVAVPHGLRSTFRQWAAECGHDRDMSELQLAHAVGSDVERAYQRSDMLERRRALVQSWAAFLGGEDRTQVVPIRGAVA